MNYSKQDMKMMAYGEYGAFLLGPVAAIGAVLALDERGVFLRLVAFLLCWYMATSIGLRVVHWGYAPGKRDSSQ